jgi:septation ring formation regulator EzrA
MIETLNSQQTQRFEYEEKRQQVNDIETMIADFRRTANELDQQIKIEQQASGITDVSHFAYPTFARAAMTRRDNLQASIRDLEKRLDRAREEAAESYEQLKLSESAGGLEAQRQIKSGTRRRSPRLFSVPANNDR